MKHLTLVLLLLVLFPVFAAAQVVDPVVQAAVDAAVPPQYAGYTALGLIAIMMFGRWIKALQNGTGIKGWLSAIWMGTNTPRLVIASLCLLILPACQSPAENARVGALVSLAVAVAEQRGALSPADAAAIREAKTIILPSEALLPAVEVSGK